MRVPTPREDQPRPALLVFVGVIALATGLGLARWGTYGRHESSTESGSESGSESRAGAEAEAEAATETETTEAVGVAEPTEVAEVVEPEEVLEVVEPTPEPPSAPPPPVAAAAPSPSPRTTPSAASALQLVRGRVAYLRCDGVPQRRGPVPCPRDEALEAAAWNAIATVTTCADLPADEGEADVVIDFDGGTTEVAARDRFASDVVRLDGARVAACLAPTLGAVRQTMGASRLVVSFRFALRAR
ncbi:hypothetical protein [Sandaracinus amylolyticus]|uniref:hypothetical protein n=1 Tax=Sandaracinus amylolyticus TaxID=927083 RepID=UPI001F368B3B|nr:hypothetical protein [Sandaracinus amylolyticus]